MRCSSLVRNNKDDVGKESSLIPFQLADLVIKTFIQNYGSESQSTQIN